MKGKLGLNLARTDYRYRRSAVWSDVCSGSRVTSGTVINLHGSDNRGGITVKKGVQRALAHTYLFNLQILIILTIRIRQVKVNPPHFKVTLITSDEIALFGHDDVTKTTHESLWPKQWIQRRTFALLHFYTHRVGDSVHWVSMFYWSKCTLSLM